MNILIINQPHFNRGDESAHKGLVRTLIQRIPDANIRVLSRIECLESIRQYAVRNEKVEYVFEPMDSLKLKGFKILGLQYHLKWLWSLHPLMYQYRKHYKWADIVVCAPGGICMGGFQNWEHLVLLHMAKFYHRPLAYYGRSFGPFPTEKKSHRRFKELSIEIIRYFRFFSIRDHQSELLAKEMGVPYVPTVDSAFLDSPEAIIPYEVKRAIGTAPYMVFVPNYLRWHYAYHDRLSHETIIQFYKRLIALITEASPELNIVMLPQLFGRDDRYSLSDVKLFRELAEQVNSDKLIVTSDNYSSDIQQAIINKARYVIGARYHSIVFAINQNVPFIALSYEHKMRGLLESLGKPEWCVEFTETMDSPENEQKTLDEVRSLIPRLIPDTELQKKAKEKAMGCMERFIHDCISDLRKH